VSAIAFSRWSFAGVVETPRLRTMCPWAALLPSTAIQYGPEPSTTNEAWFVPAASCVSEVRLAPV
jgi:hypothetical protein